MDQQTLQQFSEQLAYWAEQAIGPGRFPFRKVEVSPPLCSPAGPLFPPLVFWINRDSFMAGGVLLLPDDDPASSLGEGCACAEALGLRHFVTWGPREVVFWETRRGEASPCKTLPTGRDKTTTTAGFQKTLVQIMNELKMLSVVGALAPEELSPYYLANLCLGTLDRSLATLVETCRIAQGEGRLTTEKPPEQHAEHKTLLALLRLLALTLYDRIPPSAQPDSLEVAMQFAVESLPGPLSRSLEQPEGEMPLPAESTVHFHHLFRRLTQIRIGQDPQRAAQTLQILLQQKRQTLGASDPGADLSATAGTVLVLNADQAVQASADAALFEVGAPPLLAALALLRAITVTPAAHAQLADVMLLTPDIAPARIAGTLINQPPPSAAEKKSLTTTLRISWPTRRFSIPPRTPRWVWECLHLLGLAADGAEIDLALPGEWLTARYGNLLADLLREEFTLTRIARGDDNYVRLSVLKAQTANHTVALEGQAGQRELPWNVLARSKNALMPLALDLPGPLFDLLETGRLSFPGTADWPEGYSREMHLFSRSSLGRHLWLTVTGGQALPGRNALREAWMRQDMPIPDSEILSALRSLAPRGDGACPPARLLDDAINRTLGGSLMIPGAAPAPLPSSAKQSQESPGSDLIREIGDLVFSDGLPRFPEQYLYQYYRPELTRFTFVPPLRQEGEFFGRFTLSDADGATIEVEGPQAARALQLAAAIGLKEIELPADSQQTAAIVDQYLADLHTLRQDLVRQVHGRIADPVVAKQVTNRIWQEKHLPPWKLIQA